MDASDRELLRTISKNIGIQNDRLKAQHEREILQRKVRLSERAHMLVSLGVLSGLITYYFSNNGLGISSCFKGTSSPLCALLSISLISVLIYVPGKLLTTTLVPVFDHRLLNKINDVFLPSVNVFMVLGIVIMLPVYAFYPNISYYLLTTKYIVFVLITSSIPAYSYTKRYQKIMEKVRTSSTRRNIIVTSSISDRDGTIRITNPNSSTIPGEEVEMKVDVPRDIDIEISNISGNPREDDSVQLGVDLEANSVMDLAVNLTPRLQSPEGEIEIEINIPGQSTQTETISYGVKEDSSGATNIG